SGAATQKAKLLLFGANGANIADGSNPFRLARHAAIDCPERLMKKELGSALIWRHRGASPSFAASLSTSISKNLTTSKLAVLMAGGVPETRHGTDVKDAINWSYLGGFFCATHAATGNTVSASGSRIIRMLDGIWYGMTNLCAPQLVRIRAAAFN